MCFTPMMKQYLTIKKKYKDCFLFYRLGDFYELFLEDAKKASSILEITLTSRNSNSKKKIPMCGVPYHSSLIYIKKIIDKGYKVAICEQINNDNNYNNKKKIITRKVIKIITPGTVFDDNMLNEKENNYIISIGLKNEYFSICMADHQV